MSVAGAVEAMILGVARGDLQGADAADLGEAGFVMDAAGVRPDGEHNGGVDGSEAGQVEQGWSGLIGSQRTADFVGLRCFCFVLLVFEGDLGGGLVADPGVNTGPIVEDFDIFGNEPAGLLPGG